MKIVATGLLVFAAAVYFFARRAETAAAPAWVGYLRAAAEAGMIGGLADWFAVTALFRRPLGLPIPHTAIIPTRKDALGRNLGDFVGTHFLAEEVIRHRLRQVDVAARVGTWLSDRRNAKRAAAEAATVARGAVTVLRDEDVQSMLERTIITRLVETPVGPPLGNLLAQVVHDRSHLGLVDLAIDRTYEWLQANRQILVDAILREAPGWSPRAVDEWVAARLYAEVLRAAGDVRADLQHPIRAAIDRYLAKVAHDLRHDDETIARLEAIKGQLLDHPGVRKAFGDLWATVRRMVLDAIDDPEGDLRRRLEIGLASLGQRLTGDAELREKVDGWLEDAVAYVVTTYRAELTKTITDTVERWDAAETSRKIELQVGRDLQFIRVNGTVVGALAGVVIHFVSGLLF